MGMRERIGQYFADSQILFFPNVLNLLLIYNENKCVPSVIVIEKVNYRNFLFKANTPMPVVLYQKTE